MLMAHRYERSRYPAVPRYDPPHFSCFFLDSRADAPTRPVTRGIRSGRADKLIKYRARFI